MEQREGRIHRYKGHVIRQNIACHYGLPFLHLNGRVKDPWEAIFQQALADREPGENDLKPFWIFETQEGYKIERHAPIMPFSRDSGRINNLKKSLTLYRLVLGQPRQEELLDYLKNLIGEQDVSGELLNYRIDLSP